MKSIEKTNTSEAKKDRMTLLDYFKSLPETNIVAPRRKMLNRIAKRCNVPVTTARSWFVYGIRPTKNREHVLAVLQEETGIAPEDMWDE